jgi:hypothetical protein
MLRRLVTLFLVLTLAVVPLLATPTYRTEPGSGLSAPKNPVSSTARPRLTPKVDCCPPVENLDPGTGEICPGGGPIICYTEEIYFETWEGGVLYGWYETRHYCTCF